MALKQTTLFSFDEAPAKAGAVVKQPGTGFTAGNISELPAEVSGRKSNPQPPPQKQTRGRKKLSGNAASGGLVNVPDDEILFQKKYYSIGIVAEMFGVNISLLRFWEKEFDILKPKKNGKGDRHFRPEDIRNLKLIHHLLREKKYTIEGARDFLKKNKKSDESFEVVEELKKMKLFLTELKLSL